jgi:ABC-type branched-subunit amino acid transport system ATPase component
VSLARSTSGAFHRDGGAELATLLEVDALERRFGGIQAVDRVSFAVPEGAIVGLCGTNGSGKTTTFNCITGTDRANAGSVRFRGQDIGRSDPYAINRMGIGRTFQIVRIFAELTALENLLAVSRMRDDRERLAGALHALETVGLANMEDTLAGSLSFGQKKLLELARIMLLDPRLLLMDEPAAGVNPARLERLLGLLKRFNAEGRAILIVEHNMRVISELCEWVYVLDHGRLIAQGTPDEVRADPQVQQAYLGT